MAASGPQPDLVSNAAASATTAALAKLARAATPTTTEASPFTSTLTVEQLLAEMLRPMLKDWFDQHLPPMVERIVEEEVKKLVRRAELR